MSGIDTRTTVEQARDDRAASMGEDQLWRDAYLIAHAGASNPVAVARTLREHCKTVLARTHSSDAVRQHPALRAIAGHLAFLFGQGIGPEFADLDTVSRECKARGITIT